MAQYSGNPSTRTIRLLLVGDQYVGKTSLILSLVSEQFPYSVPPRTQPITIPPDVTPEKVATILVDTSFREQTENDISSEVCRADVVCLVYSLVDDESFNRIASYWLPKIRERLGDGHKTPVILVGNKSDERFEHGDHESGLNRVVPVMAKFKEIDTSIECSAKTMKNLAELFFYAQKAVLFPHAPLFNSVDQMLTEKCVAALTRIFKICDMDNDGVWNEEEMQEFQERCYNTPLLPQAMEEVRTCIARQLPQGVQENGITLDGYLYLNQMFIHRGRQEATWTVLRKFGYDDDLDLSEPYRSLPKLSPGMHRAEISTQGTHYLLCLFSKYDKDQDDLLSEFEFQNLLSVSHKRLIGQDWYHSVETSIENGAKRFALTRRGFISLFQLTAYFNPAYTADVFAHFGYTYQMAEPDLSSAFDIQRDATAESRATARDVSPKVVLCNVIGSRGAGKTSFMQGFLGRNLEFQSLFRDQIDTQSPLHVINQISVYNNLKFLILRRTREYNLDPREMKSDVNCFLFDASSRESWEYVKKYFERYQMHFGNRSKPSLFVAAKTDLMDAESSLMEEVKKFCSEKKLQPPRTISVNMITIPQDIYLELATLAVYKGAKSTFIVPHYGRNQRGGWFGNFGQGLANLCRYLVHNREGVAGLVIIVGAAAAFGFIYVRQRKLATFVSFKQMLM
ncbi:mitochondrial Rho GTPase 1-A-like [Paramacrobiotus metropolitanus]|uniref:mitochondrial Rho GTPase 1-A-like n=1 Tax=Paramacrobiotus metropolitanus TaxID=2943436 RepID=UPI002445F93D|nr:mitochondrial Rho GTPase 1-A-like [Paramacrobiotus metropolitanus]